jgi:hypothetical protein
MLRIPETLAQLEHQCLGLRVPCLDGRHWFCSHGHGSSLPESVADQIDIQYKIVGPGGGTWHLTMRQDDGVLRAGASARPYLTVCVFIADWLALWAGAESPSTLLRCGRLSILPEWLAPIASPDLPRLGLLGPLREIQYTQYQDVACTHDDFCSHAGPQWPTTLDHVDFRLLSRGVFGGLGQHGASPEARRVRRLIMISGLLLGLALGIGMAIGRRVGLDSLVGWVAGLWTAATVYWYMKRPIIGRLEARCRQSPSAFRWMVEAGVIS